MKLKKLFTGILCLLLIFVPFCFSGCTDDFFSGSSEMADFKIAYNSKPDNYDCGDYYKDFAQILLDEFCDNFGYTSFDDNYNYDLIRFSTSTQTLVEGEENVDFVVGDDSNSWKWTFGAQKESVNAVLYNGTDLKKTVLDYKTETTSNTYADEIYKENYKNSMECYVDLLEKVMFDILLGKTPRTYSVGVEIATGNPVITEVGTNLSLAESKTEFNKITNYIGFTNENKSELKNYILNNIIGQNAITATESVNYSNTIQDIIEQYIPETYQNLASYEGLYIAVPLVSYCDTNYAENNDNHPLNTAQELQSILIMPFKAENGVGFYTTISFNSDVAGQLDLKLYSRIYDATTQELTKSEVYDLTVKSGETEDTDEIGYMPGGIDIPTFNNEDFVSSEYGTTCELDNSSKMIYKMIPSRTGRGYICVIDENKVNQSFFEIVIEINKPEELGINDKLNFSVGIEIL